MPNHRLIFVILSIAAPLLASESSSGVVVKHSVVELFRNGCEGSMTVRRVVFDSRAGHIRDEAFLTDTNFKTHFDRERGNLVFLDLSVSDQYSDMNAFNNQLNPGIDLSILERKANFFELGKRIEFKERFSGGTLKLRENRYQYTITDFDSDHYQLKMKVFWGEQFDHIQKGERIDSTLEASCKKVSGV